MHRSPLRGLTAAWVVYLLAWPAPSAQADPFTPGNLVVLTVGDATLNVGTSAATAVSLREYTTDGAFLSGSLVSFNGGGSGTRLTQSGSLSLEGALSRSADGRYLTLAGYDAARGRAAVFDTSTTGPNGVLRVVGRVDIVGNVDLSTTTIDYSGTHVRGVASPDGNRLYLAGPLDDVNASLRTTTLGSTGNTALVNLVNTRTVQSFNGQLFGSTDSSIYRTNVALPTGSSAVTELVTGLTNAVGFVLLDQNADGTPDTLYVACQNPAGAALLKFSSADGTAWTARGSAANGLGLTGIAAVRNGSVVDVYVTEGNGTNSVNSSLRRFTDAAVFDADLSGAFTTLAVAPTGTAFRGLAFSPVAVVPEPSSLLLGALVSAAALLTRRPKNVTATSDAGPVG